MQVRAIVIIKREYLLIRWNLVNRDSSINRQILKNMSLFLTVREDRTWCSWIKKSEALKRFHLGDVLLPRGVVYLCRHPVSNMDYEGEAYSYLWPLFEAPRLECQGMWHQDSGFSSLPFLSSVIRQLFCQKSESPKIGSLSVAAPKLTKGWKLLGKR